MALTAATFLAENTESIVHDLAARLTVGTDIDVQVVNAAEPGEVDIVWACGLLTARLIESGQIAARVVAAPVFEGELAPVYHSEIVARLDGPASLDEALAGRVAINEIGSWSGHHGLRRHLGERWFADAIVSGSHRASVEAVSDGSADSAAIDHTVWQWMMARGEGTDLRVIDRSDDWPAPPISLSSRLSMEEAAAINAGLLGIGSGDVGGLDGFVAVDLDRYRFMLG